MTEIRMDTTQIKLLNENWDDHDIYVTGAERLSCGIEYDVSIPQSHILVIEGDCNGQMIIKWLYLTA